MKHQLLFFCFLIFYGLSPLRAQEKETFLSDGIIGGQWHYGFVTPHHKAIQYVVKKPISGFDITFSKPTYGKNIWEKLYRYPRYGVGYFRVSLGNNEILGYGNALYGFLNIPFHKTQRFSVNYQLSFGLGYLNKVFNVNSDPLDVAISAHVNAFARFSADVKYRVYKNIELQGGINMQHFSNGKLKSPNLGINSVTTSLGLSYIFNNTEKEINPAPPAPVIKNHYYYLVYSAGLKTYDDFHNKYYFASSLSFHYDRVLNTKYSLGLGSDLFYNGAIKPAFIEKKGREASVPDLFRAGIHAGGSVTYNRLSMILQVGYYVYARYTYITRVYNRVGLRYRLNDHLLLNFTLKSHLAIADFFEWGVGYRW